LERKRVDQGGSAISYTQFAIFNFPLLVQEGWREAPGWSLTENRSNRIGTRVSVSDHPVRSFQSRTPLLYQLYQEGKVAIGQLLSPGHIFLSESVVLSDTYSA
jgi:hypothetical protein